jgi:hypothetical protein
MIGFSTSLFLFSCEIIVALLISYGVIVVVRDLMVQLSWIY